MKILRTIEITEELKRPLIAVLGNFDGLHSGHRKTLGEAVSRARELKGTALCLTFHPHPLKVIRGAGDFKTLMTEKQKLENIEKLGLDLLISIPFTKSFAKIPAETFIKEVLVEKLEVKEIFTGKHFRFGERREGDVALLALYGEKHGFKAAGVDEVLHGSEPVSSSRIRSALEQGNVEDASAMLGRAYSIEGMVVAGKSRGRGLGYPTANLETDNEIVPADGVYLTKSVRKGKALNGVTNVGYRPTFEDGEFCIETYLLDFKGNLVSEKTELRFLKRVRSEKKFDRAEELVAQIEKDVKNARKFFSGE